MAIMGIVSIKCAKIYIDMVFYFLQSIHFYPTFNLTNISEYAHSLTFHTLEEVSVDAVPR